ncbi:MAG: ferrous iron transport protein A [Anaerolineales bacterium]
METNYSVPLSHLRAGESGIVLRLRGGRGFVGRMAALGFTPGATLHVARNSGRGPIIVDVLDTQIALGRGQANRVYVRQWEDDE